MRSTGLTQLLSPFSLETFLDLYLPDRSLVVHSDLSRLAEIKSAPELQSPRAFLNLVAERKHPDVRVRAWFQNSTGDHQSIPLESQSVAKLFESGAVTVVIDSVQLISEPIFNLLMGIEEELGVVANFPVACNVYLSPAGKGSVMHFDEQDNFLLQIHGEKSWTIAANQSVRFPTASYFGGEIPRDLRQLKAEFPKSMPSDAEKHVLKPGSVMFLPRGYWHESHSDTESFAITLTYPACTWRSLVLDTLSEQLLTQLRWRKPIYGVRKGYERFMGKQVDELVELLTKTVTSKEFRDQFLDRVLSERVYYWKDDSVRMSLLAGAGGKHTLRIERDGAEAAEFRISAKHARLIELIMSNEFAVSRESLNRQLNSDTQMEKEIQVILEFLATQGALIRRHSEPFPLRK